MDKFAPYAKAIAGFLVPFATQVLAAMQDASQGGSVITQTEWLTAALTSLVAGGAVFAVPNKDPRATHQLESVQPPNGNGLNIVDRGEGALGLLVTVLVVVILLVILFQLV